MSAWMLAVVAAEYGVIAVAYWLKGDNGMALAFVAYAVANVGFIVKG